jgi:hypothetical protein
MVGAGAASNFSPGAGAATFWCGSATLFFFLYLSILNIRFGAGAASLYGSGCTERMWLRLH